MKACTLEQEGSKYHPFRKCCTDVFPLHTHCALRWVTEPPLCWDTTEPHVWARPEITIWKGLGVVPGEAAYVHISSTVGFWPLGTLPVLRHPWHCHCSAAALQKAKRDCGDNSQLCQTFLSQYMLYKMPQGLYNILVTWIWSKHCSHSPHFDLLSRVLEDSPSQHHHNP